MHTRYLSPLIVILCNKRGAYIVVELNGAVFDHPIAMFRVILYFVHQSIPIPPLEELIDISTCCLHELQDSISADPDEENEDTIPNYNPTPDKDSDNKD